MGLKQMESPKAVTAPIPTEHDRILESDIVIALNSRSGKLLSPQCRVYVKNKEKFRQVGLIRDISLKADVGDIDVELKVCLPLENPDMSAQVKESLRLYSSLLAEKGCRIELK